MDTLCVDVSHLIESGHEIDAGETATLWGDGLNISEIASNANTIAYELLSRLMPRVREFSLIRISKNLHSYFY